MLLSLISAACMAAMCIYMIGRAKMSETRRMVWIPAACCVLELLGAGMLSVTNFPMLTALLIALRLTLFGCCGVAMRRDAAMVRARARRRERLTRELHAALNPLHEVSSSRSVSAAEAGARIA